MQGKAFVKWNDYIERGLSEEGDEVAADGQENEDDVDMKHEGCSTSDGYTHEKKR